MHMVLMGPSDLDARPESGGVLPFYDQCVKNPTKMVKTITNTYWLSGLSVHPHNFVYRCVSCCAARNVFFQGTIRSQVRNARVTSRSHLLHRTCSHLLKHITKCSCT